MLNNYLLTVLNNYLSKAKVLSISLLIILPLSSIFSGIFDFQADNLSHLISYILPDVILNTLILLIGVALGTLTIGVSLAYLTANYNFPGRDIFVWSLILPLAIPAYVFAFVFVYLFDFSGPIYSIIRNTFGSSDFLPKIRSTYGVIFTLSLAFYPYVYLLSKNAFSTQGSQTIEMAQTFGYSRMQIFWIVSIPMARPWILAGLMLVLMETLADFGAVYIFSYDTFTTAIYKSWISLFDFSSAVQLAAIMILFVFFIISTEHFLRKNKKYNMKNQSKHIIINLNGYKKWLASLACLCTLLIAFIVPLLQLSIWAFENILKNPGIDPRYLSFFLNSLAIGIFTTAIIIFLSLNLSSSRRLDKSLFTQTFVQISNLGYSIPGSVLAIGFFITIVMIENSLIYTLSLIGIEIDIVIRGSLLAMVLALSARFLVVAFHPINSAMERISKSQEEIGRSFGLTPRKIIWLVQIPIIKSSIISASLITFIEVIKEIPIVLIIRPFDWDTLSIRIFEMTSESMWEEASIPSLLIIIMSIIPLVFLVKKASKGK